MRVKKYNKFGLRKLTNGQLASVLLGTGAVLVSHQTAEAKVVNNKNGTTSISNKKASVTLETDNVRFNDSDEFVVRKTVKDAHDIITEIGKVKYRYETTDGQLIEESDVKDSGVNKTIDATYDVFGRSGKLYKNLKVTKTGNLDLEAGTKDTIVKNGKTYRRVGTPVKSNEGGDVTTTQFNDISLKVTAEGLLTDMGQINHKNVKTGGRTWIVQETPNGFSKYVMVKTPDTTSDDWTIETFKASEHNAKDFNQENIMSDGGIQEGDYVFIIERNDYATITEEGTGLTSVFITSKLDTYEFDNSWYMTSEFSRKLDPVFEMIDGVRNGTKTVYGVNTKELLHLYDEFLEKTARTHSRESFNYFIQMQQGDIYPGRQGNALDNSLLDSEFNIHTLDVIKHKDDDALDFVYPDGKPYKEFKFESDEDLYGLQTELVKQPDNFDFKFNEALSQTGGDENDDVVDGSLGDYYYLDKLAESLSLMKKRLQDLGNKATRDDEVRTEWVAGLSPNFTKETYKYHSIYTPLRAYKIGPAETTITYRYEEVKKARVIANYYKDGTTEKLADSEILPEQEIGSNYTTSPKVIEPIIKMTKEGDKIITTKTIWTLKEVPSDKDGTVPAGGKEVNYYYVKREEVIEVPKPVEPPLPTRPSEPTAPQDLSPAPNQPQSPTEPNPLGNEPRVPVKPNEPTSITPIGEEPVKPTEPLAPTSPVVPTQPITVAPKEPVTPMEQPKPGAPKPVLPPEAPTIKKPVAPQEPTTLPPSPKAPQSPTEPNPLTTEPREPKAPTKPEGLKELGEEPMKPTEPKAPVQPTLVNKPGIAPIAPSQPQPPVKPGQPSIGDEPKAPSLRKPVEPMKPIAPAEPKLPVAPTMPIAPRKPIGDANDPSAPEYPLNKPTETIAPVVPKKPNEPTPPMGPSKPSAPGIPVLPSQPSLPKAPEDEPIVPVRPTQPMVPTKPMEPVLPEQPRVPERPQELPTEPVQPIVSTELPTEPVKPEVPEGLPSEPVPPKEPTQPVATPVQPVKPQELPEEPRKPAQPKVLPETGDVSLASLGLLAGLSGLGALRRKREK